MSEIKVLKKWDLEDVPDLVRKIFWQVLEREVRPIELLSWGLKLIMGETSVKGMIKKLSLTEEHEDCFIRPYPEEKAIQYCFHHLLGRDPTIQEVDTWIEVSLNEGIDDVIKGLMNSDEYNENFGEDGIAFELKGIKSGNIVFLQADNDLFVCPEYKKGSELVVNRWKPLGWETFVIEKISDEEAEIVDGESIRLRSSNGSYVSVTQGDMGEIASRGWTPNQAEIFTIEKVTEGGKIRDGELIWLRSQEDRYVTLDPEKKRLYATDTDLSERTQFSINIQHLR